MPLRMFDEDTGWDAARLELRYTAATLAAEELDKLDKPCRAHLAQWAVRDAERRDGEDAQVDGNALVARANRVLDAAVGALAEQLKHDAGAEGALFLAFFPEAPSEVIALGLESELERLKPMAGVAKEKHDALSSEARKKYGAVEKAVALGKSALAAREAAALGLGRVRLRLQTWKEDANGLRRSVANQLEKHAIDRALPRDYADGFFAPSPRVRTKKSKAIAAPAPATAAGATATK